MIPKFWSNKETFDLTAGQAGFDTFETKLPTYWNTSFSKICLGMKVDGHHNFVVLDTSATSLYSLIADGKYRNTSLDRKHVEEANWFASVSAAQL